MKSRNRGQAPFPFPTPLPGPAPSALPPNLPVKHSTEQPLPGITLANQSILRDILKRNLPVDTIRKLR